MMFPEWNSVRRRGAGARFGAILLIACLGAGGLSAFADGPTDDIRAQGETDAGLSAAGIARAGAADGVVGPDSAEGYVGEMYKIGLGWHPAVLDDLPKDKFGLVDWVAALEKGLINPRGSISPDAPEGMPFDMNIVMPSKTGMIAGAYFPHKTHTTWMGCESCHVKIFMPLAGSNDLTMSTIVKGNACGVCHGKVAFPLNDCTRCHVSGPGAEAGPAKQP